METRNVVIIGVVAVAAFVFYRSRQAAAMSTGVAGEIAGTVASGPMSTPAPSMGGGTSYVGAAGSAVKGVTSGSFAQRAVGGIVSGVSGLAQRGVNTAVSTTVGSIKSSVGTTVNVAKTAVSGVTSAAHGIVSSIASIF